MKLKKIGYIIIDIDESLVLEENQKLLSIHFSPETDDRDAYVVCVVETEFE